MTIDMIPRTADPDLRFELVRDFTEARFRLAEARLTLADKDTPANRQAVADRLAEIDDVLDLYLLMRS